MDDGRSQGPPRGRGRRDEERSHARRGSVPRKLSRPRRTNAPKGGTMLSRAWRSHVAVGAILVVGAVIAPSARAAPAVRVGATGALTYTGSAYGSFAFVGNTVILGRSAVTGLGSCTAAAGVHHANTVASVNGAPVVTTGVINTSAASALLPNGTQRSVTTADAHEVNLLAGLITADEIKSVSTTSRGTGGFSTSAVGSNVVNLVIGAQVISGTPGPNTKIDLTGFGRVVLNEQISKIGPTSAALTVNMVHVFVRLPNPIVAVGTQIIIAHATSDLEPQAGPAFLDGHAYGTSAQVGQVVVAGPSAKVTLPCDGTKGKVRTNSVALISVPPLLATGTVTDTAQGTITSTTASGETTSTVQAANLVSALVTVDLVKADAHASSDGITSTFGDGGSTFLNLSVNGHPGIGDNVGPNTKVHIAGLGTLWLKREIQTSDSLEIRMIELIVT